MIFIKITEFHMLETPSWVDMFSQNIDFLTIQQMCFKLAIKKVYQMRC